jgi:DNA-binding MarR family transcriptional regulator
MEQSLANLSESSSAATGGGKDLRFTSDGIAHDLNRKPARVLASLKRLSAKGHVRKDSGGWLLVDQH